VVALAFHWIDRVVIARLQGRVGPPWYQPLADLVKLLAKEDVLPYGARQRACALLPMVSLAAVLTAATVIPVGPRPGCGPNVGWPATASFEGDLIVALFLLSAPALAYFMGGWVSASAFGIVGGSRALLQYFAYEVPFLMALIGPAIASGSWSISCIAEWQAQGTWLVFMQPVGFVLAFVGLIGKLKRSPFDIPKAKTEIGAGPLTEFSGRKLMLWHLSLQIKTVVGVFLLVNVFFGGAGDGPALLTALGFAAKAGLILLGLSVADAAYARLRIDQLASLGWRVLAPLALLQMVTVALAGM
ncbi:MAG: NADH-quinone oxidoreductase subunit H, partial [Ramlibacter sp.]|nr:NADH-quinone oxidoreductase subunit H [Ramlibacter sp.]